MLTRREEIVQLLTERESSLQAIANHFRTDLKEILEDVQHVEQTIRPKKLMRKPAACKSCGFPFKERNRIKTPSKCPRCRKEWIQPALFRIE
ncbi:transcriptional regulator [Candidatus Woesearchaeota archaeon]|nr:transcriptional regulator [Candidatus Woesearchaeota archaeon]